MRRLTPLVAATALLLIGTVTDLRGEGPSCTLIAGRTLRPDGSLEDNVAVVIQDGKIAKVDSADRAADDQGKRFASQTVLCPGLIDVFSTVGTDRLPLQTQPVIDPAADAWDALDPTDAIYRRAIDAGITSMLTCPAPNNLVAGVSALSRPRFLDGQLVVDHVQGPLVMAFGESVWQKERPPTSRAGAAYELRGLIEEARRGESHPRLNSVFSGKRDAIVVCKTAADVDGMARLFEGSLDRICLAHTDDALEIATDLTAMKLPVVVGPYDFATSPRTLMGAAALDRAGLEIAFAGGFPDRPAGSLRISAALAVRHGLDAKSARRAMTAGPAKVVGQAKRIGSIAPGYDGDVVVFSNDPLRLDATVLEVYLRGQLVYSAANSAGGER